jgi:peroxiredoxin
MTSPSFLKNNHKLVPYALAALGFILINVSAYALVRNISPRAEFQVVPAPANYPAPELTLTSLEGVSISLADYKGNVVLVNLWATWCEPCKEEMPALQAYHNKHIDEGFSVIAINDGDPKADIQKFVGEFELSFPVWLDPTYIATEDAFKTMNLPSSFVIDRDGIVRLQWVGGIDRRSLEKYVTPIILEEP